MSNQAGLTERLVAFCEGMLYESVRQAERGEAFQWSSGPLRGLGRVPANVPTGNPYRGRNILIRRIAQALGRNPGSAPRPHRSPSRSDGYQRVEELARRISANSPVKVSFSPLVDRGSFHPDRMEIVLPPAARFESGNALVSTLLHEVGHGTGRLPESMREMGSIFGSPSYAREELIAETTGMMLSLAEGFVPEAGRSSCDISVEDTRANSVSYLANWLNSLSLSGADANVEIPQIAAEAVRAYYVGSALIAPPNRG